ncbi:MAG: glycoside hydrolase family 43 protein [Bacteroidaceae bacterium]|nr:glycoside hydrolase family 43 protein [Bacteroidaceae bacterium]
MKQTRRFFGFIAAALLATGAWAQMRFSYSGGIAAEESGLADGSTLVQLPSGMGLNSGFITGATVDGQPVQLDDITPHPAKTFIAGGEIETFVYGGKAYSFRFVTGGYTAYLFAYFNGNEQWQEQICFALSRDGFSYTPLNGGNPVIASDTIAQKKAVRDPHILRGEDGCYYMVVTDMKSGDGWSSNDGLVLLRSENLTDWEHTAIDFPTTWPDRFDRETLTQVWAPQTIYDPEAGKYMVYYTIGEEDTHYKIYYSYANADFTELTEPQVLYDHGAGTIDADIVWYDGRYHMFFKTEGDGNGIQKATATTLHGEWTAGGTYLQQTGVPVEGSCTFPLIGSDEWVLMYDCYSNDYYEYCTSADLETFTYKCRSANTSVFTPRHGTTILITEAERVRLLMKWPPANG